MNPIWHYYLDADGALWHEREVFDEPQTLQLFMRDLEEIPAGEKLFHPSEKYRVFCQGEECRITAEDVPYVIQNLRILAAKIELIFPGGYSEVLDPSTLFVGKLNVLYCKVRGGKFTARFGRRPYLELTKHIQFDHKTKSYYLTVAKKRYPIQGVIVP